MKDQSDFNGLDLRTLESLERTWIKFRYRADQFMEQGLLPYREDWPRQKQCLVRGTFDAGYFETGTAEAIEHGVRTGRLAWSATGSST